MNDNLSRWFALVIAQVLPGLLVVFGLSFHSSVIRDWLGAAASQDVTLGGVSLIVLTAVFCGLVLSALRFLIFEEWLGISRRADADGVSWIPRRDPGVEAVYQAIVFNHYAYYQFYGSTVIGLPLLFAAWAGAGLVPRPIVIVAGLALVVVDVALFRAAKNAMQRFLDKRAQLLPADPSRAA